MFRIYLHSMRRNEWLSLEGNLAGAGVGELKGGRHTLTPANNSPRLRGHIRLAAKGLFDFEWLQLPDLG